MKPNHIKTARFFILNFILVLLASCVNKWQEKSQVTKGYWPISDPISEGMDPLGIDSIHQEIDVYKRQVYADRNKLAKNKYTEEREEFFSKGQPCFRASPLTKRYGWGVHYDQDGKMAIFGAESAEYKKLSKDKSLQVIKAMKSKK